MPPLHINTMELIITLYEGGHTRDTWEYSAHELDAIVEAIEDLWSPTYISTCLFRVIVDGNDTLTLAYIDDHTGSYLPIPDTWMKQTITMGNGKERKLVGDKIPIVPTATRLDSIEVKFTKP